jgi:t-SNARE complex subunit (syntaxin)
MTINHTRKNKFYAFIILHKTINVIINVIIVIISVVISYKD